VQTRPRELARSVNAGHTVHIGRQPIHDAFGELYGFELLFRAAAGRDTAHAAGDDDPGDAATTSTIMAAFAEFPLGDLLGGLPGFVNLTRAFLVGELPVPFDPGLAVLEILETVAVDDEVVAGVKRLRALGYELALDDFVWSPAADPLIELVSIVKVDVLSLTWDEIMTTVERCRRPGLRLLAEKVEDQAMLERCLEAGFELFQGYFLGRPQTLTADSLAPSQAMAMQLLGRLSDPDVTIDEVEAIMRPDPGLSYRLLRLTNSSANGLPRTVSSIRDAVMLVGLQKLRAWMVLISLSSAGTGSDVSTALIRAHTCELLARRVADPVVRPDVAFTLGLLDGIAETLGMTVAMMLEGLPPLSGELNQALLGTPGPLRSILDTVAAYERDDLDELPALPTSRSATMPTSDIAIAYLAAIAWTSRITSTARTES
jgi:EAL and modified HD-GYP domain-containing signal transduction protein